MAGEGIAGIHEFLQLLAGTGNVRLLGCRLAVATFAVDDSELIPEAAGIVDSSWFLNAKAFKSDHCSIFDRLPMRDEAPKVDKIYACWMSLFTIGFSHTPPGRRN